MKKCIVIPDSFKGSIPAIDICEIAKEEVLRQFPACEVITIPVADGGEGTVDCFLRAIGGRRVDMTVRDPFMQEREGWYLRRGDDAIIEMAMAAGLPLVYGRKDPFVTTTYGVGEQIRHAVEAGAKSILLGLGGSATNDGGCGAASALGVKFFDADGQEFTPTGGTLGRIERIDVADARNLLGGVTITAMCDIDNPLHGERGAAFVFGPQKGATPEQLPVLDEQLRLFDRALSRNLGMNLAELPGSGAAGGFGAGAVAFMGATLKSGIEAVLDVVGFDQTLKGAEMVFTGEGRIDSQSLQGKVVIGVARRAAKQGVPVVAVVGDVRDDAYGAYDMGVSAIFSINRLAIPFAEAKPRSKQDFRRTFSDVVRLIKACGR